MSAPTLKTWPDFPYLTVKIAPDWLLAEVFTRPRDELPACPADALRDYLESLGVRHGVLREQVLALCQRIQADPGPQKSVVLARGQAPVPGEDGRIDYQFKLGMAAGALEGEVQDDLSSIDYRDRGAVQNAREGQVLAEITPPGEGTPGEDVRGEAVAPACGKPAPVPQLSKTVVKSADGRRICAAIDGHVVLFNDILEVRTVYERFGDIDYKTGNIDFIGDVRIGGSIKRGFQVRCGGKLVVGADIQKGASVEVGGDLEVKRAILSGKESGTIKVRGALSARSLENAVVHVGGEVTVLRLISASEVYCRGKLRAKGAAEVRGSLIEAVGGMELAVVGTEEGGVKNTLIAGLTLMKHREFKKLDADVKELAQTRDHIYQGFASRYPEVLEDRRLLGQLSKEEKAAFDGARQEAQDKQQVLDDQINKMKARMRELEEEIFEDLGATIIIEQALYPPVDIAVGESEGAYRRPLGAVAFYRDRESGNLRQGNLVPGKGFDADQERAREKAEDVKTQVLTRRLAPRNLEREMEKALAEGGPAAAISLGRTAMKEKRYQTTKVFNLMGRAFMDHLAKVPAESRAKVAAESVEMFRQALKRDAEYLPALSNLAGAYGVLGKEAEALQAFERAVRLAKHRKNDPQANRVFYNYGLTLIRLARAGRDKPKMVKALDMLEQYLVNEPEGEKAEDCRKLMKAVREKLQKGAES